jgi:hypothetical protein
MRSAARVPHSSQPHRDPGSPASGLGSLGWGEWDSKTLNPPQTALTVAFASEIGPGSRHPNGILDRKGTRSRVPKTSRREAASALPKAGVQRKARNDLNRRIGHIPRKTIPAQPAP